MRGTRRTLTVALEVGDAARHQDLSGLDHLQAGLRPQLVQPHHMTWKNSAAAGVAAYPWLAWSNWWTASRRAMAPASAIAASSIAAIAPTPFRPAIRWNRPGRKSPGRCSGIVPGFAGSDCAVPCWNEAPRSPSRPGRRQVALRTDRYRAPRPARIALSAARLNAPAPQPYRTIADKRSGSSQRENVSASYLRFPHERS